MRLIKRQTTNLRSITGKGVQYDIDNQVVVDSNRAMVLPAGTEAERPGEAGVVTGAVNGQIRYNTSTNELEAYQDGAWRNIRFKEPNRNPGIHQQSVGVGDITATNTIFGPLNSNDPDFPTAYADTHVIVLIENVFQISGTNYTLIQNPPASDPGSEIDVTTITDGEYKITSIGTTDFTLIGAASNTVNTVFTYDSSIHPVPTGDGTVRLTGQYVKFTSGVPSGKPVTVLHNFDK